MNGLLALIAMIGADIWQYDLVAYEAPGMHPSDKTTIIPSARTRLPGLLKSCGILHVQSIPATDGAAVFRFRASKKQADCVQSKSPRGVSLQKF